MPIDKPIILGAVDLSVQIYSKPKSIKVIRPDKEHTNQVKFDFNDGRVFFKLENIGLFTQILIET